MRQRQIYCEYQPYMMRPPVRNTRELYAKAASNDNATVDAFAKTWIDHARLNKEKFGDFGTVTVVSGCSIDTLIGPSV